MLNDLCESIYIFLSISKALYIQEILKLYIPFVEFNLIPNMQVFFYFEAWLQWSQSDHGLHTGICFYKCMKKS